MLESKLCQNNLLLINNFPCFNDDVQCSAADLIFKAINRENTFCQCWHTCLSTTVFKKKKRISLNKTA